MTPTIDHLIKMAANTEAKATEIKTSREISIKPGLSFSTFEELNAMVNLKSNRHPIHVFNSQDKILVRNCSISSLETYTITNQRELFTKPNNN